MGSIQDGIKSQYDKLLNSALDKTALYIGKQTESAWQSIMNAWYDQYKPKSYKRTWLSYEGSTGFGYSGEYKKISGRTGNQAWAGIEIVNVQHENQGIEAFAELYKYGSHGRAKDAPMGVPPQWKMITKFRTIANQQHIMSVFQSFIS